MKKLLCAAVLFLPSYLAADEASLIESAMRYYENGEYYNAATEAMRCQYLYPSGTLYPMSLLLQGKALYAGGDYSGALSAIDRCRKDFPSSPAGNEAAYLAGRMRISGSAAFALSHYSKYIDFYGDSIFTEKVFRDSCWAALFMGDFPKAKKYSAAYRSKYPQGEYLAAVKELEEEIAAEEKRPTKSMLLAVGGSLIVPGFGYFYTGRFWLGTLSLLTNACLIAIVADGIIRGNIFRWAFFGLLELSFYGYSINGAVKSVQEYNSRDRFVERMKIKFEARF